MKTSYVPVNAKFSTLKDRASLKISNYNWSLKGKRTVETKKNNKTVKKAYTAYDIIKETTDIKSNTNLYATYKLTFKGISLDYKLTDARNKAKGNVVIDTIHVLCGKKPTFIPNSKNYKGYDFNGYRVAKMVPKNPKNPNGEKVQKRVTKTVNGKKVTSRVWNYFNPKNAVNKPITYYAGHERKKIKITLNYAYDGRKVTKAYNYGHIFNQNTSVPKRKHYDFTGWNDSAGKKISSFEVTSKRTVYAGWQGHLYTISFGTYTLSDNKTVTPNYSNTVSIRYPGKFNPSQCKLNDIGGKYSFNGWNVKKNKSNAIKAFTVKEDIVLYPAYEAKTYSIHLYGNYGKRTTSSYTTSAYSTMQEKKCKYWGSVKLSNPFTRAGSSFHGWRTSSPESMNKGLEYYYIDAGGTTYDNYLNSVKFSKGATYKLDDPEDKNFYAVWKQDSISVFYYTKKDKASGYSVYQTDARKAGQKLSPINHPGTKLEFVVWSQYQNQIGDVYEVGSTYRLFTKSSYMYAQYMETIITDSGGSGDNQPKWAKVVCRLGKSSLKYKLLCLATQKGWLSSVFDKAGFKRNSTTKTYHAKQDCLQQHAGYNDAYDWVFNLGTSMAREKFKFSYSGKDYILWAWKGDYLNFGAGAELVQ